MCPNFKEELIMDQQYARLEVPIALTGPIKSLLSTLNSIKAQKEYIKAAQEVEPELLLELYELDAEDPVIITALQELSNGFPFLVFNFDGELDIKASAYNLRCINEGEPEYNWMRFKPNGDLNEEASIANLIKLWDGELLYPINRSYPLCLGEEPLQ